MRFITILKGTLRIKKLLSKEAELSALKTALAKFSYSIKPQAGMTIEEMKIYEPKLYKGE